jgi:hypothetical protein
MTSAQAPSPRARKLLRSGLLVDLEHPRSADIKFSDISHALAHTIRFGGHGEHSTTVAQHSVHVSHICPPHLARWGLLHDAAEAYLGDMSTELKRVLPYFKELERRFARAISIHFDVPIADVKHWDLISLLTERRDNGPFGIDDQELLGPRLCATDYPLDPIHYEVWGSERAECEFTDRAGELGII